MTYSAIKNEIYTVRGHLTEPIARVSRHSAKESLDRIERLCAEQEKEHEGLRSQISQLKCEMQEAAELINCYLQEIPLNPKAHNWLIRNGYKDESYQADVYGQEIHKEG